MTRIVVVSRDEVRERMAAPGIRIAEIARALAAHHHDVTIALRHEPEISIDGVRQVCCDEVGLAALARDTECIIIAGAGHHVVPMPRIPRRVPLVVDMSFPLFLEVVAVPEERRVVWPPPIPPEVLLRRTSRYLTEADAVLCASEAQRQFYLGCMTMVGRVRRSLIEHDAALRGILMVVPFGCPAEPPVRRGKGLRDTVAGVGAGDYVVLWSGGLGDWYDPEVVVRAVAEAVRSVGSLRLVFIGAQPRDGHLPETDASRRVRALATDLGLVNRHVFFHDEWVPYSERQNWIGDADACVVASPRTLESELAVRTRFLDYVWCATPVICTRGGVYADLVEARGLGVTVSPGSVAELRDAIVAVFDGAARASMRSQLERIRPEHTWPRVLEPLIDFCAHPHKAADHDDVGAASRRLIRNGWTAVLDRSGDYVRRMRTLR